jgi:4-hydroxy-2-oxoglutarate aldolase
VGGKGSITGMGNVAPRVCCKAFELAVGGDLAEARRYAGVISEAEVSLGKGGVVGTKVSPFGF